MSDQDAIKRSDQGSGSKVEVGGRVFHVSCQVVFKGVEGLKSRREV